MNIDAAAPVIGVGLGGQGWLQVGELGLALLLSACVGLEREIRQKDAGLRTHTLVGLGAALFMLVSKYGFSDVIVLGRVILDPSRVAAQIVSGIGFLGAGLIFVRRDTVRGLTTAASVWVTAAIGAAAGAGLAILATATTAGYLLVVSMLFSFISRRLPRSATAISSLRVRYHDGKGALRRLLQVVTSQGFTIDEVSTDPAGRWTGQESGDGVRIVQVTLHVHGKQPVNDLAAALTDVTDVDAVFVDDANAVED